MTLSEVERRHILETLEKNHGIRTRTARELGIGIRTLRYRLEYYKQQGFGVMDSAFPLPIYPEQDTRAQAAIRKKEL